MQRQKGGRSQASEQPSALRGSEGLLTSSSRLWLRLPEARRARSEKMPSED